MFRKARFRKNLTVVLKNRATAFLLSFVILLAALAPVLPTVAQDEIITCGLQEHTHTSDCYETRTMEVLDENGEVIGEDVETVLVCELTEHQHSDECYQAEEKADLSEEAAKPEKVIFTAEDNGVTVTVTAEAGVFPEGTTMTVTAIDPDQLPGEVPDLGNDVPSFTAVDICFYDSLGNEIEPDGPVEVSMSSGVVSGEDTSVIHMDDDGNSTVIEDTVIDEDTVSFATDGFSIYIIIGNTIEKTVLASDGHNYKVTVRYGDEAGIPEGADLAVEEITSVSADYDSYIAGAEDALGAKSGSTEYARLFDIKIVDENGNKLQPAEGAAVDVKIELADNSRDDLSVVHFADGSSTGDVIDAVGYADGSVSFETDGFSVYAVIYTVDFEFSVDGDVYSFSVTGGSAIKLSELLGFLGIFDNMTDEQALGFIDDIENVEFTSPDLLWIGKAEIDTTVGELKSLNSLECEYSSEMTEEQISSIDAQVVEAGEWMLISVAPFDTEETLTVTLKSGEQFTVKVTDAAYDGSVVTPAELDGKTGALIRTRNNIVNAVLDSARNSSHLQAVDVTINSNTHRLTTSGDSRITEWTFNKVEGTDDQYYISSPNGYLNIGAGSASVTDTPQALVIQKYNNEIRIKRIQDEYALNNTANVTANGYSSWNGSSYTNQNEGEWFTVYDIAPVFPVTLHFVKEDGSSFSRGEVFYKDGTEVEIVDGNFKIDLDKLEVGDDGIVDLSQFKIEGYTLSNTHKSTYQDINDSTDNYRHSIIGNELRYNDGILQYRLFYTNHDKAGSHWFDVGMEPERNNNHWQYNNGDPTSYDQVADNDAHPYDYYLVYNPVPVTSGATPGGNDPSGDSIGEVGKSKTLTSNGDGTYTLELGVTTSATGKKENNGINLIIVFDTSSSMTRSVTKDSVKYDNYWENTDSRFYQAVEAMDGFLSNLNTYNTAEYPDTVQLALVDFNYNAYTHTFPSESSFWTTSTSDFMKEVRELSCPQGTNWAQALDTARTVAKTADDDPTFVLLMTDGAPSQYWGTSSNISGYFVSGEGCYLGARDEARDVLNDGLDLYGIFSFGVAEDEANDYLGKLVDYAYNSDVKSSHRFYANNQQALISHLTSLIGVLTQNIAHTGVNYHDGIAMDTTSTALSANVNGTLGSITYTKTGGTTDSYTVVADAFGNAKFVIGSEKYTGSKTQVSYKKISGTGNGITTETATTDVYSCTVDGKTYYMPIATLETDSATKVGDLNWDLSPLGMLENGANYKISFVVWPNQEAYDYVADLNNGKMEWNKSTQTPVYADEEEQQLLYYKDGVANYPNIVYYPNTDTYAVLTNTVQEVSYYVGKQNIHGSESETTYEGQHTVYPETPDPMPLTSTKSEFEKVWNVERDPGVLAHYLYGVDEENNIYSKKFKLEFEILQVKDGEEVPYMKVPLGWDEKTKRYVWDQGSTTTVTYSGHPVEVGTRWSSDFSIATGLILSEEKMIERGLDTKTYPSGTFGGKKYYILEPGHDYVIKEPDLTYEFDFKSPVYHPMLVDGVVQNVNFTVVDKTATFTLMTHEKHGLPSIKIENTLRGYINLNKVVLDTDGKTVITDDETKFTYTIKLDNPTIPGPFTAAGSHIPWYGISGLFYHTKDNDGYHYYQARSTTTGNLTLTDEDGNTFNATCVGDFDQDAVGPTEVRYMDGGKEIKLLLYGNQMDWKNDNQVSAEIEITRAQTLNIANVPVGTTYTITEANQEGYQVVKIEREIKESEESQTAETRSTVTGSAVITGEIVENRDNHIVYYNKILEMDINIQKLDGSGKGLPGAVFRLVRVTKTGEKDVTGVAEIGTVQKEVDGQMKTFQSSFETTGDVQIIHGLPSGTYRLYEVLVPAGYVNTYKYIQFEIRNHDIQNVTTDTGDTGKLVLTHSFGSGAEATLPLLQINNTPGVPLPSAGGSGTYRNIIVGTALILGALVMMLKKYRTA